MNKRFLVAIATLLLCSFLSISKAQDESSEPVPVTDKVKRTLVDSLTSGYYKWDELSLSGKLSSPMLPMSASVKIYMKKDETVIISLAAPLIGEVGRLEVDKNQVLGINKYKNTYSSFEMSDIETLCPGGLTAIQNLLLGRISILGSGELSRKNSEDIEIYAADNEDWVIIPVQDFENGDYVYFYIADNLNYLLSRFMVIMQNEEDSVSFDYGWEPKNMTIAITAQVGLKAMSATLKLNSPDSKLKKIERTDLGNKYRKVSPRDLMKM